jgi:hypothetical protein
MTDIAATHQPFSRETRVSIGFINWAHAMDHYVLLIYPTVVIGLEAIYARTYGELIALSTAAFISFGVFSLRISSRLRLRWGHSACSRRSIIRSACRC